jgi:hypothetical protein
MIMNPAFTVLENAARLTAKFPVHWCLCDNQACEKVWVDRGINPKIRRRLRDKHERER